MRLKNFIERENERMALAKQRNESGHCIHCGKLLELGELAFCCIEHQNTLEKIKVYKMIEE